MAINAVELAGRGKALGSEFRQFILKGNVLDMAAGVIIGGAFGKIVWWETSSCLRSGCCSRGSTSRN